MLGEFPIWHENTRSDVSSTPQTLTIGFYWLGNLLAELTDSEISSYTKLLHKCRIDLLDQDSSITGFNVGFNDGHDAGQTVMHCHVHIIPRRSGDVINPMGGIRGVIPGKKITNISCE